MRSRESVVPKRNNVWLSIVFAGSLAVSACASATGEAPMLVFDDLGGGSSIIQVYPGVQDIPQDKQYNGTYTDGEAVEALCVATGRQVSSDPSVGEAWRTSDKWVLIAGVPDKTQYATTVYVENPEQLVAKLPVC